MALPLEFGAVHEMKKIVEAVDRVIFIGSEQFIPNDLNKKHPVELSVPMGTECMFHSCGLTEPSWSSFIYSHEI